MPIFDLYITDVPSGCTSSAVYGAKALMESQFLRALKEGDSQEIALSSGGFFVGAYNAPTKLAMLAWLNEVKGAQLCAMTARMGRLEIAQFNDKLVECLKHLD